MKRNIADLAGKIAEGAAREERRFLLACGVDPFDALLDSGIIFSEVFALAMTPPKVIKLEALRFICNKGEKS